MTILYKRFVISVTADNIEREADARLEAKEGEKIHLLWVGIAPSNNEDSYIMLYRGREQLFGRGIYHAILDDYSHKIDVDAYAEPGKYFIAKAYGANARTIIGVYAYEVTK